MKSSGQNRRVDKLEQEQPQQEAGAEILEPATRRKKRVKDIYTPAEVAEILGITRRTLYSWIKAETIPAFKVGPKLWAVRAHVVDALKEGRDPWRAEHGFQGALAKKEERAFDAFLDNVMQDRVKNAPKSSGTKGGGKPAAASSAAKPSAAPSAARPVPGLGVVELPNDFGPGVLAPMAKKAQNNKAAKGRRR
jgi:excisionase family DNA binding protein